MGEHAEDSGRRVKDGSGKTDRVARTWQGWNKRPKRICGVSSVPRAEREQTHQGTQIKEHRSQEPNIPTYYQVEL